MNLSCGNTVSKMACANHQRGRVGVQNAEPNATNLGSNATNLTSSLKLTASLHLKMDAWNTFGMAYFQGRAVSFREGIYLSFLYFLKSSCGHSGYVNSAFFCPGPFSLGQGEVDWKYVKGINFTRTNLHLYIIHM